jgi:hypothetical protein
MLDNNAKSTNKKVKNKPSADNNSDSKITSGALGNRKGSQSSTDIKITHSSEN